MGNIDENVNLPYEFNLSNVFSEKLFKDMADRMAADGYREAGYTYVNIDVSVQNLPFSKISY